VFGKAAVPKKIGDFPNCAESTLGPNVGWPLFPTKYIGAHHLTARIRPGDIYVGISPEFQRDLSFSFANEVLEINRHVTAIVEAAKEQSTARAEINTAVNTMDQGTQQNAAMVEQSTAASHTLAREALGLNELLSRFKISDSSSARRPVLVSNRAETADDPVQTLRKRVAGAFGAAAAANEGWKDF
jgi:uncharacterized protein YukE